MKTFLVTGANSGIGLALTEALAAQGEAVILAGRSEARTRTVIDTLRARHPEATLEFLKLDLGSLRGVKAAAESWLALGRPLDVLINNAGVAGASALSVDGFEVTLATNHLGPFLLTELLLPRLREAPQGRIVNVASVAQKQVKAIDWSAFRRPGKGTRDRFARYALSKLLNVIHARELARRLSDTHVTTYSLHPGAVATNIWREVPWPIRPIIKRFMIDESQGADTPLYCATAPELATSSGLYYFERRPRRVNPLAEDEALAKEVFSKTEEMIRSTLAAPPTGLHQAP